MDTSTCSPSAPSSSSAESGSGLTFGFVTEGILLTCISTFGLMGSLMSVCVLMQKSVRGSFSRLLTALAAFDALFLAAAILTFGLPTLSPDFRQTLFLQVVPVCYGLTHVFRVGSVYATLSVTLERFFAIVWPLHDFEWLKLKLIPFTALFAVIYNVPKFFEVTTSLDEASNTTVVVATELRSHRVYVSLYLFWSKFLLVELVPYVVIVILNSVICVKIAKSASFRQRLLSRGHCSISPKMNEDEMRFLEKQRQEHKLGLLLVGISVLFIVCQSIKLVPDCYELLFCRDQHVCQAPIMVNKVVELSHLLVCFNSAANFVVYLLGGEKFRRAFFATFIRQRRESNLREEPRFGPSMARRVASTRCSTLSAPTSTHIRAASMRL